MSYIRHYLICQGIFSTLPVKRFISADGLELLLKGERVPRWYAEATAHGQEQTQTACQPA